MNIAAIQSSAILNARDRGGFVIKSVKSTTSKMIRMTAYSILVLAKLIINDSGNNSPVVSSPATINAVPIISDLLEVITSFTAITIVY